MTTKQKLQFIDEVLTSLEDTNYIVGDKIATARKYCRELIDEQPSIEVDWNEAPEWANYHTIDYDGTSYWFEHEPIKREDCGCWDSKLGKSKHSGYDELIGMHWQETLTKRP